MCGIAGIITRTRISMEQRESGATLKNILEKRGRDGHGTYEDKNAILVQTLLSFQGTPGKLPLTVSNRYVIAFNGEIYNHLELRLKLSNKCEFKTNTDTETLLQAWIHWGKDCLTRIQGMFSFFIWDNVLKTGFAARDPLGVKPFFFTQTSEVFAFSSEAGSLVQARICTFKANETYISDFLIAPYFSGALSTPFEGVEILKAGEYLELQNGNVTRNFYFQYNFSSASVDLEELEDALSLSVKQTLITDKKLGLFLSGGLDSTLIAALAKKTTGHVPKSFSLLYPENDSHGYQGSLIVNSSDHPFALKAANYLNADINTISVPEAEFRSHLLRTLDSNDLICAWEQEVSQNILGLDASKYVKGILNGDAADETHFGYHFIMNDEIAPSPLNLIHKFGTIPLRDSETSHRLASELMLHSIRKGHDWSQPKNSKLAMSHLVLDLWLGRLLHNGDCHTMAHGLEARVPFANQNVLALSQKVSPTLSFSEGIEKSHLRTIAQKYLPQDLAWRKKSALTKSFAGKRIIHEEFVKAWNNRGEVLTDIVDMDTVKQWLVKDGSNLSDQEVGLEFRILATLTWFRRYT